MLPTIDDAIERLCFIGKIEKGLRQSDGGRANLLHPDAQLRARTDLVGPFWFSKNRQCQGSGFVERLGHDLCGVLHVARNRYSF